MKAIYIAGPYRGNTAWDVHQNIECAKRRMYEVAEMGLFPLCPHTMTADFDGTFTDTYWLECTLELMRRCDAVYMTGNWEKSEGSRGEYEEAQRLGIPVFFTKSGIKSWMNSEFVECSS